MQVLDEPVFGPLDGFGYSTEGELPDDFARYLPEVPTDADGRPLLRGDAEQVRGDVAVLAAAGVENLVVRFWTGAPGVLVEDQVEQMRRFRDAVIRPGTAT